MTALVFAWLDIPLWDVEAKDFWPLLGFNLQATAAVGIVFPWLLFA